MKNSLWKKFLLLALGFGVVGLFGNPTWAKSKPKKMTLAILPSEGSKISQEQLKEFESMAKDELSSWGLFDLVSEAKLDTQLKRFKSQKRFFANCLQKKPCIRRIGRMLQADVLFHLRATQTTDGVLLQMRSFHVPSGTKIKDETESSRNRFEDLERGITWITRKTSSSIVATMWEGQEKGKLEVACDHPDALLFINKKPLKKRTNKVLKLTPGVFQVEVKKEGFQPFLAVVVVAPSKEKKIHANLVSLTGEPEVVALAKIPEPKPEPEPESKPAVAVSQEVPAKDTLIPVPLTDKPKPEPQKTPSWALAAPIKEKPKTETVEKKPFLPSTEKAKAEPEEISTRFYQTWWFWTAVGVVVAGAGAGTYFALSGGGEDAGLGSARVVWQ